MNRYITVLLCACVFVAASLTARGEKCNDISQTAELYFDVYKQREDFSRFISFYSDGAVVEDLIYGHTATGKEQISTFFDWTKGDFSVVEGEEILEVETQIVSGNNVVTKGKFKQFKYFGEVLGPWRFVIYQHYNAEGKIESQEDWINYTPKAKFIGGENLN